MHVLRHVSLRHSYSILKHNKYIINLYFKKSTYHSDFLPNASFPSIFFDYMHLKVVKYIGNNWPNIDNFKETPKNASGYSFDCRRSWQPELYRIYINVDCPEKYVL